MRIIQKDQSKEVAAILRRQFQRRIEICGMPSKPWTPYPKSFEAAVELLKQGTVPAPFASMADAARWIAERKFIDVISTDLEAESLIEAIDSK